MEAKATFARGRLILWEINPTNNLYQFSGRRDGPFEIWLMDYHEMIPEQLRYAERQQVQAFNEHMRYMYDHPERFTPGAGARKRSPAAGATNQGTGKAD